MGNDDGYVILGFCYCALAFLTVNAHPLIAAMFTGFAAFLTLAAATQVKWEKITMTSGQDQE